MSKLRQILDSCDPHLAWLIDQCRERFGTQMKHDQVHIVAPGIEVGDSTLTSECDNASGPLAFTAKRRR